MFGINDLVIGDPKASPENPMEFQLVRTKGPGPMHYPKLDFIVLPVPECFASVEGRILMRYLGPESSPAFGFVWSLTAWTTFKEYPFVTGVGFLSFPDIPHRKAYKYDDLNLEIVLSFSGQTASVGEAYEALSSSVTRIMVAMAEYRQSLGCLSNECEAYVNEMDNFYEDFQKSPGLIMSVESGARS